LKPILRSILTLNVLFLLIPGLVLAEALSRDDQIQIIQDYLWVSGQSGSMSAATAAAGEELGTEGMPHKCGMSAAADFAMNRSRFDRDLLISLGAAQLNERPITQFSYLSPSGKFKIHYDKSGVNAVYRSGDDSDSDGVPDYVEATGLIADSVWNHEIITLGYPIPPSDSFYTSESDSAAYDIYLVNLAANFYGLAYPDSVWTVSFEHRTATSFIKLDNDYSQLTGYQDRPLDAIRVTMAHEFFHAIQFGIDPFESEPVTDVFSRRYWMELSSVWMEEEVYDNINDYYGYLPYFFDDVSISLQQFNSGSSDLHPYAMGIFAMFLSQKFGAEAIRETWLKCGELGVGPDMHEAMNDVIDSISNGSQNLASAFAEFAQWNYFTGARAQMAPGGMGYEEASSYPEIPDQSLNRNSDFQILLSNIKTVLPEHMGAAYFRFEGGLGVKYQLFAADTVRVDSLKLKQDTICNLVILDSLFADTVPQRYRGTTPIDIDWAYAACPSLEPRPDTCSIKTACDSYTRAIFDSTFNVEISLDSLSMPWYLSTIYQLSSLPDSNEIEKFGVPAPTGAGLVTQTLNPEQFCSYLIIVTPVTTNYQAYRTPQGTAAKYFVKYLVDEDPDPQYRASCFGEGLAVDEQPSELLAYPNPSVIAKMEREEVRFKFRLQAAEGLAILCAQPTMTVDLYTLSGEKVSSLEERVDLEYIDATHQETVSSPVWDMANQAGSKVASGVYIAVARLYCDESKKEVLAENKAKLALIR
jgi:hypothetical protein